MEVPSQGVNLSRSSSCDNAGSFNPLIGVKPRDQTHTSTVTQDAAVRLFFFCFFVFFFVFLGLHLRHMEVPRLGVELEL